MIALICSVICATEILRTEEPMQGINVMPPETNPWHCGEMTAGGNSPDWAYREVGPEFFQGALGKPGSFDIRIAPTNIFVRDVAINRGWGKLESTPLLFEMDVRQSVKETEWEIPALRAKFKVKSEKPGETVHFKERFMHHRALDWKTEFEIRCKTKGVKATLRNMRLVPVNIPISWRAVLKAAEKPHRAGVTFVARQNMTLFVNGQEVYSTPGAFSNGGILRFDITKYLRAGENEISFKTYHHSGYQNIGSLVVEAFAVANDGTTTYVETKDWECKYDGQDWRKPYGGKIAYGMRTLPNGRQYFKGDLPMHAGALAVKPHGEKYPVFDYDTGAVWDADVPPAVKDPVITCVVSNALTGRVEKKLESKVGVGERNLKLDGALGDRPLPAGQHDKDENIHSPTPTHNSNSTIRMSGLKTGAYLLNWTLTSKGKVIDRLENEMVIAGPLDQDVLPLERFEKEFAKRLTLIQEVDCTQEITDETRFLDHASMWTKSVGGKVRPRTGLSRVIEEKGVRFREIGGATGDHISYKLDVKHLGKAHVLEFEYPLTRPMTIYSSINEAHPCDFPNNRPEQGANNCNASGSVHSGLVETLKGGKGRLRYVFFPGSKNITVSFDNGAAGGNFASPAGVCSFKVYEVEGRLPAVKLPKTDKLFCNHSERPQWWAWGASVNPCARHGWIGLMRLGYAATFAGAAHRVEQLRFQGQNGAIEGVYMYNQGFPSKKGVSRDLDDDFDAMYVYAKLCKHNGIRLYGSFEVDNACPLFLPRGLFDVSKAEIDAGVKSSPRCIDAKGDIAWCWAGPVANILHPAVQGALETIAGEIYERYAPTKGFEGLCVIGASFLIPGYPTTRVGPEDLSFDDLAAADFEKATGIRLDVPKTGKARFVERAKLLQGKYRQEWLTRRSQVIRRSLDGIRKACGNGAWKLLVAPAYKLPREDVLTDIDPAEEMRRFGFALEDYPTDGGIRLVPRMGYVRGWTPNSMANIFTKKAMDYYRRTRAVYITPASLNERQCATDGAKRWWWQYVGGNCVYDAKGEEDNALFDLKRIAAEAPIDIFIQTWLDCNYVTGHGEAMRKTLVNWYNQGE